MSLQFKLPRKTRVAKKHIMVLSGKGGVGKSFVAVNLALALRELGYRVGILDVDVHGPNVPILLGATDGAIYADERGMMIPIDVNGIKVMSVRYLLEQGVPLIRRGVLKSKLISDMVNKTNRGELDYLVIDSPPGTGDELLSTIENVLVDLGVVVSTPQRIAMADVERAVGALRRLDVIPAGVVLNMSYIRCPFCGNKISLATIDKERMLEELKRAMLYNEIERKLLDHRMKKVKVSAKDPKEAKKELDKIRREMRKDVEKIARELSMLSDVKEIERRLKEYGLELDLSRVEEFDILAEIPLDVETMKAIDAGKPMKVNKEIKEIFLSLARRLA